MDHTGPPPDQGERGFAGDNLSDTLVNILEREPDWSLLPAETPRPVLRIPKRCPQKDVEPRLPDAGTVRLALEEALSGVLRRWNLDKTLQDGSLHLRLRIIG